MQKEQQVFYKILATELDPFGLVVWQDTNLGDIDEVHEFVKKHINGKR